MAMHSGGLGRAMSDINVTPMVDVMLVLLTIFMVTAPLIQQGVPVDLPKSRAQPLDAQDNRLVLTLTKQGRIYLGTLEIPYEALRSKLVDNLKLRQDKQLYLHADRNLAFGQVVDVMALLKEVGVENLGMVTDPMPDKPPGRP